MAYIPLTNKKLETDNTHVYRYTTPTGGVKLSDDGRSDDGKCVKLCNMDVKSGRLTTRRAQYKISGNLSAQGTLYSVTKELFCKRIIIHIGNCLYSYSPDDNTFTQISSTFPDEKSLFCAFMSKLYIYCAMRVFSLDEEFNLTEEEADAPLLFNGISAETPALSARLNVPINLIAPRISVRYTSGFSPILNGSGYIIELPYKLDISRSVKVYADGNELRASWVSFDENFIRVSEQALLKNCDEVVVKYYVKNHSDIGFEYVLGDCRIAEPFGGNTLGGTRIFFTGNEEKKGYYYKSVLQNPLCVLSDEVEIIGDGCENVTAVIKMHSYLIIFTERSVYRMSYSLADDGGFFAVKQIGIGIGCDCPDSVQLIDNRAVFANSEKGIFIVDPVGDMDEHNIKPISGNINADFLANDAQTLKKSCGIDFDRKYMLFACGKAYIWDYDESTFSDSGNYKKSQERLVWYMYDGLTSDMYFEYDSKLLSLDKTEVCFYAFDGDDLWNVKSFMRSGKINFGDPKNKKFVTGMELDITTPDKVSLVVAVYADGEKCFDGQIAVYGKNTSRPKIRLPKKKLYDFDFEISGSESFEIGDVFIEYMTLKK